MDLRERRELDNGIGDAFSRAFELVLTPAVFGFFGYLLDGRIGTRPLFMIVFFAFVFAYEFWKLYRDYESAMQQHEQRLRASVGLRPTPIDVGRAGARAAVPKPSLRSRLRASVGLRPTPVDDRAEPGE